ncbi:hypothetical protein D3C78_990550 [compost metagenome]
MRHGGLLLGGSGDLLVLVDDHADRAEDVLQRLLHPRRLADGAVGGLVTAAHGFHRRADTLLQAGDHLLDFLGGLLGALGQRAHLIGHHGEAAALLAGPRRFDGGVERQQVGLLGDTLDHIQHAADRGAVGGQAVDHRHRLVDLSGQALDAAHLLLDQRAAVDGFLVHALRAAHRGCSAARDFLGGGGHLVHRRGDLVDLVALAGHRVVALRRHRLDPHGLTLDLGHRLTNQSNQLADLFHGIVEGEAQVAQLIAALHLGADRHVAGSHLIHRPPEAFQGGAGGGVEAAVQVDDGEEHQHQRSHQHDHLPLLGLQTLLQFAANEVQHLVFQAVGLRHQHGGLVEELPPRAVQRVGHDQALFEQLEDLFQRFLAGGDIGG